MDSCSFCAAIACKLLCLPWATFPEAVRAHCWLVATVCSPCCHTALIASLPCLEPLITAPAMWLGWQVPRAALPRRAGCSCSQGHCELCRSAGAAQTELQLLHSPAWDRGGQGGPGALGSPYWNTLPSSVELEPTLEQAAGRIWRSLLLKD